MIHFYVKINQMTMQKKYFSSHAGEIGICKPLAFDIIWDRNLPQSLKQATRQKSGSSCRVQGKECTSIPSNWETFLKLEQNKAKLFHFLTERIGSVGTEGKQLCTTVENNFVCTAHINNVHDLAPCDHEESIPGSFSTPFIVPSKDMIESS